MYVLYEMCSKLHSFPPVFISICLGLGPAQDADIAKNMTDKLAVPPWNFIFLWGHRQSMKEYLNKIIIYFFGVKYSGGYF